jgi:hypothetical protein
LIERPSAELPCTRAAATRTAETTAPTTTSQERDAGLLVCELRLKLKQRLRQFLAHGDLLAAQ